MGKKTRKESWVAVKRKGKKNTAKKIEKGLRMGLTLF